MTDSVLGHCPQNTYDTYTWIYRKGQMPIIMERVMLWDPGPSHDHHSEVERSEKASGTGLVPTQGTLLGQPCARWCRQYCLHISFLSCVHRKKVDRSWRTPGCRSLHSDSKVYLTIMAGSSWFWMHSFLTARSPRDGITSSEPDAAVSPKTTLNGKCSLPQFLKM